MSVEAMKAAKADLQHIAVDLAAYAPKEMPYIKIVKRAMKAIDDLDAAVKAAQPDGWVSVPRERLIRLRNWIDTAYGKLSTLVPPGPASAIVAELDELMTPRNEGDFAACQDAAALIRSQEAKIKRMAEALKYSYMMNAPSVQDWIKGDHADALRDAGVMP